MSNAGASPADRSRRRLIGLLMLGVGGSGVVLLWPADPLKGQIQRLAAAFTRLPEEGHEVWAARLEYALAAQLHPEAELHFEQHNVISSREAILAQALSWQSSRKAWFVRIERIEMLADLGDSRRRARVSTTQSDTDHGDLHGELRDIELTYERQNGGWLLVDAKIGSAAQGPPEERP